MIKLIITISIFILTNLSYGITNELNDSVMFVLNINDTCIKKDTLFLDAEFSNNTQDTILILMQPSIIEDNNTNVYHLWRVDLSSLEFTTPSSIYLEEKNNEIKFIADGEMKIIFDSIPLILVVIPNNIIRFKFTYTASYLDSLSKSELDVWGYLTYGYKKELRENANIDLFQEFAKRFNTNKSEYKEIYKLISPKQLNAKIYRYEDKIQLNPITKIIWNTFRYQAIQYNKNRK